MTYVTTIQLKLLPDTQQREKLDLLLKRDSKVINRVLGILNFEQETLFQKREYGTTIKYSSPSRKTLADLMLATKNRKHVKYDLKSEFLNISHNELSECIDHANGAYLGYLNLRGKQRFSKPPKIHKPLSRTIGKRRFDIDEEKHIFSTMYSLETNLRIAFGHQSRVLHDKLHINYVPCARLTQHLEEGKILISRIIKEDPYYYLHISFEMEEEISMSEKGRTQLAIMGIDLGIATTATAAILTDQGIEDHQFFVDHVAKEQYINLEKRIGMLQQQLKYRSIKRYTRYFDDKSSKTEFGELSHYLLHLNRMIKKKIVRIKDVDQAIKLAKNPQVNPKYADHLIEVLNQLRDTLSKGQLDDIHNISSNLNRLRNARRNVKEDMINQLTHQIKEYVINFCKNNPTTKLYLSVGKPNGIQHRYRRGSGNRWLRKKINNWAFFQFQNKLEHNLSKIGMEKRLIMVSESYTSSRCWQCNKKGNRPKQGQFYCTNYHCLNKIHADVNGALNIAKRGIKYRKLVKEKDYHLYYIPMKKKSKKTRKSGRSLPASQPQAVHA